MAGNGFWGSQAIAVRAREKARAAQGAVRAEAQSQHRANHVHPGYLPLLRCRQGLQPGAGVVRDLVVRVRLVVRAVVAVWRLTRMTRARC